MAESFISSCKYYLLIHNLNKMKKLIITSIVATSLISCSKSIDGNKKEAQQQTVYFRLSYESKAETVTAKNVVIVKFK